MEIMTIQMGKRWEAVRRGVAVVDTTVKSGNQMFAPTWDMVMGHKGGDLSDEEYTQLYRRRMSESWKRQPVAWQTFLHETGPMALACYCPAGQFCHRHLLKDLLQELCARQGIPFQYYGELT